MMNKWIARFFACFTVFVQGFCGINQTDDLSPILSPDALPFEITISLADFQLPSDSNNSFGLQGFVYAVYNNKWLLLAGRTNGVHGFSNTDDNFPPREQNRTVYVVDPIGKTVVSRSLLEPSSQLSVEQIETLSVTSAQYNQYNNTLYVVGGYGLDTALGRFTTKSTLTAIDVPGLMGWVEGSNTSAAAYIRQTSHPLMQVTGGFLTRTGAHEPFLLILGQNFLGSYTVNSNGDYTQQIRPFKIIDNGIDLYVKPEAQFTPNSSYRRRDLSVLPIVQKSGTSYAAAVVALSGVFTLDTGVWTVPILINGDGSSSMADPANPSTFKQGMNNYDCARTGLYSKRTNEMYMLLFGGISYGFISGGSFQTDPQIPFINQVTTVKIDAQGNFQQYLMDNQYPEIFSQFSNPGNTLLFGAEARFIAANNLPAFPNLVFSLDELGNTPSLLGYIVGGIQSTLPNTSTITDSAASPYIFSVYLKRRQ
jgi:DNA-dependent RNA polymerase auxiliary subunit epsilon